MLYLSKTYKKSYDLEYKLIVVINGIIGYYKYHNIKLGLVIRISDGEEYLFLKLYGLYKYKA